MVRGTGIFLKCRRHLKILGGREMIWTKFHTEGPQVLGARVQNAVALATWHLEFLQSCTVACKLRPECSQFETIRVLLHGGKTFNYYSSSLGGGRGGGLQTDCPIQFTNVSQNFVSLVFPVLLKSGILSSTENSGIHFKRKGTNICSRVGCAMQCRLTYCV